MSSCWAASSNSDLASAFMSSQGSIFALHSPSCFLKVFKILGIIVYAHPENRTRQRGDYTGRQRTTPAHMRRVQRAILRKSKATTMRRLRQSKTASPETCSVSFQAGYRVRSVDEGSEGHGLRHEGIKGSTCGRTFQERHDTSSQKISGNKGLGSPRPN
jgi:hypothetical protein